jgi:hypothetical protein
VCADAAAEFCIQTFKFTPTGGTLRAVTPVNPAAPDNPEVNVVANFPNGYTGPNGIPDQSGMLGPLSLNFYDTGSFQNGTTKEGMRDGTYHVIIRTGDYDPSQMTLTGEFVSYSVVQGSDGYFTIDLTAKPKPIARVVVNNNVSTMLDSCEAQNWVGTCKANDADRHYLNVSFSMFSIAAYRAAMRGSWIATNASTTQISTASMAQGEFNVVAKGPHTVPSDFVAGVVSTDVLNPAYFEAYLPFTMMSMMMSSISTTNVTTDTVRGLLANPATFMTGSIYN